MVLFYFNDIYSDQDCQITLLGSFPIINWVETFQLIRETILCLISSSCSHTWSFFSASALVSISVVRDFTCSLSCSFRLFSSSICLSSNMIKFEFTFSAVTRLNTCNKMLGEFYNSSFQILVVNSLIMFKNITYMINTPITKVNFEISISYMFCECLDMEEFLHIKICAPIRTSAWKITDERFFSIFRLRYPNFQS